MRVSVAIPVENNNSRVIRGSEIVQYQVAHIYPYDLQVSQDGVIVTLGVDSLGSFIATLQELKRRAERPSAPCPIKATAGEAPTEAVNEKVQRELTFTNIFDAVIERRPAPMTTALDEQVAEEAAPWGIKPWKNPLDF